MSCSLAGCRSRGPLSQYRCSWITTVRRSKSRPRSFSVVPQMIRPLGRRRPERKRGTGLPAAGRFRGNIRLPPPLGPGDASGALRHDASRRASCCLGPRAQGGLSTRPRLKSRTTKLSPRPADRLSSRGLRPWLGKDRTYAAAALTRALESGILSGGPASCEPLDNKRPDQETSTIDRWGRAVRLSLCEPGTGEPPVPTEHGPHGDDQG